MFKATSNKICFSILTLVMAFSLVLASQIQAQNTPVVNIGVFDLQKILNESSKAKAARSKLTTKYNTLQNNLKAKEKELDKMKQDLEKQSSVLSEEAFAKKANELRDKVRAFQEQMNKYTEEMQKAEADAFEPIMNKALKAAADIGKQRGYIMVIETQKAGVVYNLDSMDLTSEVLKAVDK